MGLASTEGLRVSLLPKIQLPSVAPPIMHREDHRNAKVSATSLVPALGNPVLDDVCRNACVLRLQVREHFEAKFKFH